MQVIGNARIAEDWGKVNTLSAALGHLGASALLIRFTIGSVETIIRVSRSKMEAQKTRKDTSGSEKP